MAGSNNFADIITKRPSGKKAMKSHKRNMKRKMTRGSR